MKKLAGRLKSWVALRRKPAPQRKVRGGGGGLHTIVDTQGNGRGRGGGAWIPAVCVCPPSMCRSKDGGDVLLRLLCRPVLSASRPFPALIRALESHSHPAPHLPLLTSSRHLPPVSYPNTAPQTPPPPTHSLSRSLCCCTASRRAWAPQAPPHCSTCPGAWRCVCVCGGGGGRGVTFMLR